MEDIGLNVTDDLALAEASWREALLKSEKGISDLKRTASPRFRLKFLVNILALSLVPMRRRW